MDLNVKYVEELVVAATTGTPEQKLTARLQLVRALRRGARFLTRSFDLVPDSTHALATWGAV